MQIPYTEWWLLHNRNPHSPHSTDRNLQLSSKCSKQTPGFFKNLGEWSLVERTILPPPFLPDVFLGFLPGQSISFLSSVYAHRSLARQVSPRVCGTVPMSSSQLHGRLGIQTQASKILVWNSNYYTTLVLILFLSRETTESSLESHHPIQ